MKTPISILAQQIQNDKTISLVVPQKLSKPHKLIIEAKESLIERNYLHNGLLDTARGQLRIKVSPKNVNRALAFLDTLIKICLLRGHAVNIEGDSTCIVVQEEKFKISLREKLNRTEAPSKYSWKEYNWNPTGKLILSIYDYPKIEWTDGKLPLEDKLAEIIATMELQAVECKRERLELEAMWAEQRRQEQIRKEIELKKERDQSEFNKLLKESEKWNQVQALRIYINAIEARANENDKLSDQLRQWLLWARKKADNFDPLLNFPFNQLPEYIP